MIYKKTSQYQPLHGCGTGLLQLGAINKID